MEFASAGAVDEAALVHLNRKDRVNSLNVGVRRAISILAGEFGLGEAGVDVEETVDPRPIGDARFLDDMVGIDVAMGYVSDLALFFRTG